MAPPFRPGHQGSASDDCRHQDGARAGRAHPRHARDRGAPLAARTRPAGQTDVRERARLGQRRGRRHAAGARIPYIALNPGASYRGLHDSLVNYLGNETPQMLLCLHEESAVAIAHGYAKVTGKAMAAAVHSNVGLFHATMAIFNAWCDRMPVVILGATGPVDAAKRRPWIDWIHTARDQGAIVRDYTKWDDQPASAGRGARSAAPRPLDRQYGAEGSGLHQSRCGDAGIEAGRAAGRRSTSTASCRSPAPRPSRGSLPPRACCSSPPSIPSF